MPCSMIALALVAFCCASLSIGSGTVAGLEGVSACGEAGEDCAPFCAALTHTRTKHTRTMMGKNNLISFAGWSQTIKIVAFFGDFPPSANACASVLVGCRKRLKCKPQTAIFWGFPGT